MVEFANYDVIKLMVNMHVSFISVGINTEDLPYKPF